MLDADQVNDAIFAYLGGLGYDVSSFQVNGDEVRFRAVKTIHLVVGLIDWLFKKFGADSREYQQQTRQPKINVRVMLRIRQADRGFEIQDSKLRGLQYFFDYLGIVLAPFFWIFLVGISIWAGITFANAGIAQLSVYALLSLLFLIMGSAICVAIIKTQKQTHHQKQDLQARLSQGALIPYAES